MPTLNLNTNVPVDPVVASDILKDATKIVAKTIGKPESYVMIVLNGGVPIAFAGSEKPAAYGEVISIGGLSPNVNGKLSSALADLLETKLSVNAPGFTSSFMMLSARSLASMARHSELQFSSTVAEGNKWRAVPSPSLCKTNVHRIRVGCCCVQLCSFQLFKFLQIMLIWAQVSF